MGRRRTVALVRQAHDDGEHDPHSVTVLESEPPSHSGRRPDGAMADGGRCRLTPGPPLPLRWRARCRDAATTRPSRAHCPTGCSGDDRDAGQIDRSLGLNGRAPQFVRREH
jgi:hypothetical protein